MSYYPPPDSPPPAHPSLPSSSSFPPFASSSSHPPPAWSAGQSFYFGGSAAPPILNTRRAPPRKGQSSPHPSSRRAPPPPGPPPPAAPPVLLTDARCACCDTGVRYPRSAASFRCTVCETINDLNEEQRRGKARQGVPAAEATPVTEEQFLSLLSRFEARQAETDEQLARRLAALEVGESGDGEGVEDDDPEDLLLAYLVSAFDNLPSINASFRPTQSTSTALSLPRYEVLSKFYALVRERPAAMDVLRGQVEGVLRRPGVTLLDGDGGWVITLIECPIFLPDFTPDPSLRRSLLSRFIGLLSNLPNALHHRLVQYLSSPSYPRAALQEKIELIGTFLSWRIGEAAAHEGGATGGGAGAGSYRTDWMVSRGARVASLLFNALTRSWHSSSLPLSTFYITLIDSLGSSTLINDFVSWENGSSADEEAWETGGGRGVGFKLCQYPFLMSLGVKMGLLGWDGERQMMERAREAYRSTFARNQLESPIMVLRVRREHLVSDSLRQISSNRDNLKKTLRIAFEGEEGVDAGGLRKEWFLLLCRQLFSPEYGMFHTPDPQTNFAWFNPASHVDAEDYWLVGVVLGLALYNMATLDVPLPTATYKKLLAEPVTLPDLAQFNPSLARGLQQLVDWDEAEQGGATVQETFCRTFVGEYEAWGEVVEVELCQGGKEREVTVENRAEYVSLLTAFHLTNSVSPLFDAFSAGFHEVVGGNALSLFKAHELELVVRGSEEPLEVDQLRAVTVYEGFRAEGDETVELFWSTFSSFSPTDQRRLLSFITASDRTPATGTSALQLKLQCLGNEDSDRFPVSHTCFNTLGIYRYGGREKMERMLRRAMEESEGFGLR
ncbi:hypothetical protein JCM11251_002647 [Rhodosporidiobolus azoricus]